jgi:hypothetical protein
MEEDSGLNCGQICAIDLGVVASVGGVISIILFVRYWWKNWCKITELYERSILKRWKLPIPGLELCELCGDIKRGFRDRRTKHYESLKRSGQQGCWCCWTIGEQLARSIEDHDFPPITLDPIHLKVPRLLLWFAGQTWTETGYLDHLRQIGKSLSHGTWVMVY